MTIRAIRGSIRVLRTLQNVRLSILPFLQLIHSLFVSLSPKGQERRVEERETKKREGIEIREEGETGEWKR